MANESPAIMVKRQAEAREVGRSRFFMGAVYQALAKTAAMFFIARRLELGRTSDSGGWRPSHQDGDAAGPDQGEHLELGIGRQAVEEDRDFSAVVLGPVGLREHVVNYIKLGICLTHVDTTGCG